MFTTVAVAEGLSQTGRTLMKKYAEKKIEEDKQEKIKIAEEEKKTIAKEGEKKDEPKPDTKN